MRYRRVSKFSTKSLSAIFVPCYRSEQRASFLLHAPSTDSDEYRARANGIRVFTPGFSICGGAAGSVDNGGARQVP